MKNVVKVLLVISILLVTFGLPATLQLVTNKNSTNKTQQSNSSEIKQQVLSFVSVPPTLAIKNGQYIYQPTITSNAGETVTFSVVTSPSWLQWNAETKSLIGQVPADITSFSIALEAEAASGQKAQQSFTVTVEDAQSVKGASSNRIDPFHPITSATPVETQQVNFLPEQPTTMIFTTVPTNVNVLGATNTATAALNVPYLVSAILLFLVAIVLSVRLATLLFGKQKSNSGAIVIERGRV